MEARESLGSVQQIVIGALFISFLLYSLKHKRLDYWDPNIFLAVLAVGMLCLLIVSLLTSPEPEVHIEQFFAQLQTPSDLPSVDASAHGRLAVKLPQFAVATMMGPDQELSRWTAEKGRQLLLVNLLHLRNGAYGLSFFKAYHDDLKGLLIGFALSAGLVVGLWMLLRF